MGDGWILNACRWFSRSFRRYYVGEVMGSFFIFLQMQITTSSVLSDYEKYIFDAFVGRQSSARNYPLLLIPEIALTSRIHFTNIRLNGVFIIPDMSIDASKIHSISRHETLSFCEWIGAFVAVQMVLHVKLGPIRCHCDRMRPFVCQQQLRHLVNFHKARNLLKPICYLLITV